MAAPTHAVAMRAGGENVRCVNVYKTIADKNNGIERKNPPIATPLVTVTFCKKDVEPGVPEITTKNCSFYYKSFIAVCHGFH